MSTDIRLSTAIEEFVIAKEAEGLSYKTIADSGERIQ